MAGHYGRTCPILSKNYEVFLPYIQVSNQLQIHNNFPKKYYLYHFKLENTFIDVHLLRMENGIILF